MKEFSKHIEEYANYRYSSFSRAVPPDLWGNKQLAEAYLQKYWLDEQDYQKNWKPVQDKIFNPDKGLPDLVYRPGFSIMAFKGGCLFLEEDFKQLQHAMRKMGDKHFVIIQSSQEFTRSEPMFRMKFPVDITWDRLMSGNYISAVLFEMNYNEYLVFSESGKWGKYAASDYSHPLDLIGFKPELSFVFIEQFSQSKEELEQVREWLPKEYDPYCTPYGSEK